MGDSKVAEQSKITRLLHVKLTSEDYGNFCSQANAQGLSVDEFAARLILAASPPKAGAVTPVGTLPSILP